MPKVKCTVDSCEFWGEGQVCNADEIWVKNDITGDPDDFANHFINASQVEFSEEFGEESEDKKERDKENKLQDQDAQTSPQTCCDTMRPKRQNRGGCRCH
ncbi:MAG: DUF1540 domain-containing protein [Bacillota bacterium]